MAPSSLRRPTLWAAVLACSALFAAVWPPLAAAQAADDPADTPAAAVDAVDAVDAAAAAVAPSHFLAASCSCAMPLPLPLSNGKVPRQRRRRPGSDAAATAPFVVDAGSGLGDTTGVRAMARTVGLCHSSLGWPKREGQMCGASLGICGVGLCCSQRGLCSRSDEACDGTCQCRYSGVGSRCKGSFPLALPNPLSLPAAKPGGACGPYVARCPSNQCCTQFGFCVDDSNEWCRRTSCQYDLSPGSPSCSAAHGTYTPKVVRIDWNITAKNFTADGFTREYIVINNQLFTGFTVNVGDRVIIPTNNQLTRGPLAGGLSVHWHGMLMHRTNIQDGVVPVTQRPTAPGETFVYNFIADAPGTYWWHSHSSVQ